MASTGNRGMSGGMGGTETQQRPTGNFGPTSGQTQGGGTGTGGTLGAVKDKAREVASDASDVVSQVRDKAQEFASDVAQRAGDAWDSTRQQVQNYASTVASTAENAWDEFGGFVRRYPVASLAVAFGVGFLAAEALSSNWDMRRSWMYSRHNG
jgi:ElaB/YqjD/DUF883 family membrane-anchored ribosome-binding protein